MRGWNTYSHSDGNCNGYGNANGNGDSNSNSYSNYNADTYRYSSHTNAYTKPATRHTEASADSASSAVMKD
jgi:hypothetical protein